MAIHCPVKMTMKVKIISSAISLITFYATGNFFCYEFIRDKSDWNVWEKLFSGLVCLACTMFGLVFYDVYSKRTTDSHSWRGLFDHYIAVTGIRLLGIFSHKKMVRATKNIKTAQEQLLLDRIRENQNTIYGQEHNFASIASREDFVRLHPLTRYNWYENYIERICKGETNVLTRDNPVVLAVTSGTSGKSHMIPIIKKQSTFFFTNGIAVLFDAMIGAYPGVQQLQKTLKFFYTPKWRQSEAGIPIGPNSSSPTNSKHILNLYTTPRPGFDIMTEPEALYIHLLFGLKDRHVGILEANFASLIYAAMISLKQNWIQLTNDIENGSVHSDLDIDGNTKLSLNVLLRPEPERAKELREEFKKGFEGIVCRIWPHCNLIFCVDTGTFEHYGNALKHHYCKGVPIYSPIYAATEGLIGLNIWPLEEKRRYLLHPKAQFYEFIPLNQLDNVQPETVFMDQVIKGESYELVISNYSGLYRYRFGDVVNVYGFYNQCPIVEFLYRQGQVLNVHGEKTSEKSFYMALTIAASGWTDVTVMDYCCVESVTLDDLTDQESDLPHYVLFIETEDGQYLSNTHVDSIDKELRRSYVYDSFRKKGSIGPMVGCQVLKGTFHKLRDFMLENTDASPNQFKVPRVLWHEQAARFMWSQRVRST